MLELEINKAKKLIQNNFEYLDEVVESAILNVLEDAGVEEESGNIVEELQYIYDTYVAEKKYGKKIV
jgi:hypothetical protein